MRVTLGRKLFVSILASNAILIALIALLAQWNLQRDFSEFLFEQESKYLGEAAERLATIFATEGDWHLLEKQRAWTDVIAAVKSGRMEFINPYRRPQRRPPLHTNPPRARPGAGPGPRPGAIAPPNGRPGQRRRPRAPGPLDENSLAHRLSLLDANRRPLHGPIPDTRALVREVPVTVDENTVGWLVLTASAHAGDEIAQHFEAQQQRTLWWVSLVAFIPSSFIAIWLAHHLVSRVKPIAQAARQLASGRWDTRAEVRGEDEIADLSADFNRLATTLGEAEYARKQWVADIAHELRTPLSVLRAQVEAIQDGIRPYDASALDTVHDEVQHLTRLVDDLYHLSMSDVGGLDYQMAPVDIGKILRDVIRRHEPRFEQSRIAIKGPSGQGTPLFIQGDAARLDQLISNLLENSLRYTDPGGRVEVDLLSKMRAVEIFIADSAPGVPLDTLPRLFDRLYRVEPSRSRQHGGSGIGLSICKNIVVAHMGTIEATASSLGGLGITVNLPLRQNADV
ncbi:MAG: HAMP domain-containing protein [Gammaproteobacteria bacterium]|nr:HAMP domain-containing protein [Gammaproteobacteria bacterium]